MGTPTHFRVQTRGAGKAPLDVQFVGSGPGPAVADFEVIDNHDYSYTVKYTPLQQVRAGGTLTWERGHPDPRGPPSPMGTHHQADPTAAGGCQGTHPDPWGHPMEAPPVWAPQHTGSAHGGIPNIEGLPSPWGTQEGPSSLTSHSLGSPKDIPPYSPGYRASPMSTPSP